MKKTVLSVFLLVTCLLFSVTPVFARQPAQAPVELQEIPESFSNSTSILFVPEFQFTIVSERISESIDDVEVPKQFTIKTSLVAIEWEEGFSVKSPTDKKVTAKFQHNIYDSNGYLMATVNSTVIGWYNLNDNWKAMESVTVTSVTGPFASSITTSAWVNGEYGYLSAYFNGLYLATFTYQVMVGYIV